MLCTKFWEKIQSVLHTIGVDIANILKISAIYYLSVKSYKTKKIWYCKITLVNQNFSAALHKRDNPKTMNELINGHFLDNVMFHNVKGACLTVQLDQRKYSWHEDC